MAEIDPWGSLQIEDYTKLFEEFGISPFKELLPHIKNPHRYMRRGIIFGHRSYEEVVSAMKNKRPFSAMSGFMPSGHAHLGHKMVLDELIWHQEQGASIFLGIADCEAHAVRNVPWKECHRIAVDEYIASAIALGLKTEKSHIYFQSKSNSVKDLAFELGCRVNLSELSAIYGFTGETSISHMLSAITQSADILHPQLSEHGGPRPVIIPVGADQDPHIRLTRGLASKMRMFTIEIREERSGKRYISVRGKTAPKEALQEVAERTERELQTRTRLFEGHVDIQTLEMERVIEITREIELAHNGYAFIPPAATYHRFMSGLQGGKMSSSTPESLISLTEPPEDAAKKVKRAKTGGRVSLKEQQRDGGDPERCMIYELLLFHLTEDDRELEEIYRACKDGKLICGQCKRETAEKIQEFLREHQKKMEEARDELEEYNRLLA